jgi:uncharacterized protein YkwD
VRLKLAGLVLLGCAIAAFWSLNTTRPVFSQTAKPSLSQPEADLLTEINQARANPQLYAGYLEKLKPLFKGKQYTPAGARSAFDTQEGWSAVEEAIKFMRAAKPVDPLTASSGLCLAAKTHVTDQSASGSTGHRGPERMLVEDRVKPYGSWQGGIGENLTYGNQSARERLLTWLIDDGFATRGHRNRLMSNSYKAVGICCGPHPEYGSMCVLTLAGSFTETSTQANQKPAAKPVNSNASKGNKNTNAKPQKY